MTNDDWPDDLPFFGAPSAYTLRIELLGVEPAVWRRFVVAWDTKLPKFNRILQTVMGWQGYHGHVFSAGDIQFGPEPDTAYESTIKHKSIMVTQVLPLVDSELVWEYDFGDGWEHRLVVEARGPLDSDVRYPFCLAGERACPPEDCGGVPGYMHLQTVIADPTHAEYEGLMSWLDRPFDPDLFDLEATTAALRKVR